MSKEVVNVQMEREFYDKVMTNVAGSGDTMEYFSAESIKELGLQNWASSLKWNNEGAGSITIAPATKFTFDDFDNSALIAVGIDFQSEYRMPEPFNGKLIDVLLKMGIPQATIDSIPRITKEEFYNLDNGGENSISFTIDGTPYQAEEGITWGEFVESSYNDGSVDVNTKYGYIRHNGNYLSSPESGYTMEGDAIISGFNYQYLAM
jgi:hypothetical protein